VQPKIPPKPNVVFYQVYLVSGVNGTVVCKVKNNGKTYQAIVDTGTGVSLMSHHDVDPAQLKPLTKDVKIVAANNQPIIISGKIQVYLEIGEARFKVEFLSSPDLKEGLVIIGNDINWESKLQMCFRSNLLRYGFSKPVEFWYTKVSTGKGEATVIEANQVCGIPEGNRDKEGQTSGMSRVITHVPEPDRDGEQRGTSGDEDPMWDRIARGFTPKKVEEQVMRQGVGCAGSTEAKLTIPKDPVDSATRVKARSELELGAPPTYHEESFLTEKEHKPAKSHALVQVKAMVCIPPRTRMGIRCMVPNNDEAQVYEPASQMEDKYECIAPKI